VQLRRAIWIAAGILALGLVLSIFLVKPGRISAQALDETNGHRRVLIKNSTGQLYTILAWGEFYSNNDWERPSFSNTFLNVAPASSIETVIAMPANTNTPRRIAFVYKPVKDNGPGRWIERLRTRLRLKAPVEREYLEIP
jgi:hypothetical protein